MQKTNVIEQSSLQMFKLMTIDQLTIDDQPLMVKLMTRRFTNVTKHFIQNTSTLSVPRPHAHRLFFGRYFKDKFYRTKPRTIDALKLKDNVAVLLMTCFVTFAAPLVRVTSSLGARYQLP